MTEHPGPEDTANQRPAPARPVPTGADVQSARRQVRAAAAEAGRAEEALPRRIREIAGKAGGEAGSRVARRIGLIGAILAALMSVAISTVALNTSADAKATAATVSAALERLAQANNTLESRGQEPVPTPPTPDPTDAIAAAVLAQVLASLPATPTADDVAAQLRSAVTANVMGPAMDRLAAEVSNYFARNPPRQGPAPSPAEIQAAVDRRYAANPPRDGEDGLSPPCLSEPRQCRGEDGTNGANGTNGTNGQDGADSTVPGPQGPSGPPPGSWTWPDPLVLGVTHTCTRTGGPDEAAEYACT